MQATALGKHWQKMSTSSIRVAYTALVKQKFFSTSSALCSRSKCSGGVRTEVCTWMKVEVL